MEETISQNIKDLRPDIVFLQELMHPSQCDDWVETNTQRACFKISNFEHNQALRLLGKDYTILCAARMREEVGHSVGMECIAIRSSIGTLQGCNPGELCFASEGLDKIGEQCNPEFVIMSAVAHVRNFSIKLINAHPHSREKQCRDRSLMQIFEQQANTPVLAGWDSAIIAGDSDYLTE